VLSMRSATGPPVKAARFRDHANPKKSRIVNSQSVNVQYFRGHVSKNLPFWAGPSIDTFARLATHRLSVNAAASSTLRAYDRYKFLPTPHPVVFRAIGKCVSAFLTRRYYEYGVRKYTYCGRALNPCKTPFVSKKMPTIVPSSLTASGKVATARG
jgi:hypothetical protein